MPTIPARICFNANRIMNPFLLLIAMASSFYSTNGTRFEKRVIHLFSSSKNNPILIQQRKWLDTDRAGLLERDLLIETHIYQEDNRALFIKYQALEKNLSFCPDW